MNLKQNFTMFCIWQYSTLACAQQLILWIPGVSFEQANSSHQTACYPWGSFMIQALLISCLAKLEAQLCERSWDISLCDVIQLELPLLLSSQIHRNVCISLISKFGKCNNKRANTLMTWKGCIHPHSKHCFNRQWWVECLVPCQSRCLLWHWQHETNLFSLHLCCAAHHVNSSISNVCQVTNFG
jgi:hypothetical protein